MSESSPGSGVRDCLEMGTGDRRNLRNQVQYTVALLVWAVVFVGATFLVQRDVVEGALVWVAAFLPSVFGLWVVAAYTRYLRQADELMRSIELQALAVTVSVGFIVWPLGRMLERLGVAWFDWDVTVLTMIAAYVIASVAGRMRYR